MANNVKVTKKDRFNQILALAEVQANADLKAFVEHELEQLAKKNSARSAQNSELKQENAQHAEEFLNFIIAKGSATSAELRNKFGLSPQKISPIMRDLEDSGRVNVTINKRVKVFTAVINEAEDAE